MTYIPAYSRQREDFVAAMTAEADVKIAEIQAEGEAQLSDITTQAGAAQVAATNAAGMVLDAAKWGPLASMATTTTTATNVTNTYIFNQLIPAGAVLTTLLLYIAAGGAGALNIMFGSRNSDGTFNLIDDLTDQVIGSTGAVPIPLQKSGVNYTAPSDGFLAIKRSGTTTATFNYRSGPSGSTFLATGKLTGSNVTVSAQTLLPAYQINGYLARKGEALFDRATFNGAGVAFDPNAPVSFSQGTRELATGSTTSGVTTAYFDWRPAQRSGFITNLTLPVATAGTFLVYLMRPSGSSWRCVKSFFVTTASTGAVNFTAGTDFDSNIAIEKGWMLGVSPQIGALTFGASSTGGLYTLTQPIVEGVDYALTPSSLSMSIVYSVSSVVIPLSTMQDTMGDRMRGNTTTTFETFGGTSTPSNWTLGTWTVNNGLISPATGGNTVVALNSAVPRWATRASWEFNFTLGASGLIQFGFGSTAESLGQYIRVNTVTQQIQICTWSGSGSAPVVKASKAIGFATSLGSVARDYTMTVRRKVNRVYITLSDNFTGERFTWSVQSVNIGRMSGQPCFLYEAGSGGAGDVTINWARFGMNVAKDFHALFIGNSNTDGFALADWQMPSHAERIENIRNKGDTLCVARHGATSTTLLAELNRVTPFISTVKYVFVMIGTNDTVQATLDANMASIIAAIVAKGATPVLCTIPPKSGGLYVQTNTNIRTRVYGNYPYVDVCRALTTSHDNVNWDTTLALADLVHINQLGYAALISQNADGTPAGTFACEAPYLFTDSMAGYAPVVV